ncbi:hypothetical protein F0315_05850 [Vibrio cholerae]|nr:hypothetical protein F0315_05850 [Vibrio cholerae]
MLPIVVFTVTGDRYYFSLMTSLHSCIAMVGRRKVRAHFSVRENEIADSLTVDAARSDID